MVKRILQPLTIVALVNLIYQYWPRGEAEPDELIPVMNAEGQFGYIDGSGRVRIEFEWEYADPFDQFGVAVVWRGIGNEGEIGYGVINQKGQVIVPADSELAVDFFSNQSGLALVNRGNLNGWVNREGEEVIPVEWDKTDEFDEFGYVTICRDDQWGLADNKGRIVIRPEWSEVNSFGSQDVAAVRNEKGWGLIGKDGGMLVENQWDYKSIGQFGDSGLARVVRDLPQMEVGWMDTTGDLVIPFEWSEGQEFDDKGMAAVMRDGKWGWINRCGELVLPLQWQKVQSFNQYDVAKVKYDDKWGLIDREGKYLAEPEWSALFLRKGSPYIKASREGGAGLLTMSGEIAVQPKWNHVWWMDEKGHASVRLDMETQGLVDRDGNVLFEIKKEGKWGWKFGEFDDNELAAVSEPIGGGVFPDHIVTGWIDRSGKTVIQAPDGWWGLGHGRDGWANVYVIGTRGAPEGIQKWMSMLIGWFKEEDEPQEQKVYKSRAFNKDGTLIWSSTWLRHTTKAWLYLIAALMPLLVVQLLGGKKKRG